MKYREYLSLTKKHPKYYTGRWEYLFLIQGLVDFVNPLTVLELGPAFYPLIRESDTMDIRARGSFTPTFLWDATKVPWPIKDKRYDLFLASQVWEHLDNKQSLAFLEAKRIARNIILSFPYKWQVEDSIHRNIDEKKIVEWTNGEIPRFISQPIGHSNRQRIIYWFSIK